MQDAAPASNALMGRTAILVVTATAILTGLGACLLLVMGSRSEWCRAVRAAEARIIEVRNRSAARPVLRGVAMPGNAWDDYRLALGEIERLKPLNEATFAAAERTGKSHEEAGLDLLPAYAVAIQHLRNGAGRAEAQFPYEWDRGRSSWTPDSTPPQQLAVVALKQARTFRLDGRPREAAKVVLDVAQFARDLAHNAMPPAESSAMWVFYFAFGALREHLAEEGDNLEIARELALLDDSFPRLGLFLSNETTALGVGIAKKDEMLLGVYESGKGGLKGWLENRSMERWGAEALPLLFDWARRVEGCDALTWGEMEALHATIQREALRSGSAIAEVCAPRLVTPAAREHWSRKAELRLLRIAFHYRATGRILSLADPFGKEFKHRMDPDGRLMVWSVGANGLDQEGEPGSGILSVSDPRAPDDLSLEVAPVGR